MGQEPVIASDIVCHSAWQHNFYAVFSDGEKFIDRIGSQLMGCFGFSRKERSGQCERLRVDESAWESDGWIQYSPKDEGKVFNDHVIHIKFFSSSVQCRFSKDVHTHIRKWQVWTREH